MRRCLRLRRRILYFDAFNLFVLFPVNLQSADGNAAEYTFSFQYHRIPLPFLSIEYLQIVLQKST